jgi:hypothetical protein
MKICVIVAWFGPWPAMFPLFMESVRRNGDVDFLFVTDNPQPAGLATHMLWEQMTLDECRGLFARFLGEGIHLHQPYKLCDYRPMFGRCFQDRLAGYDFWGHCDVDIIFGSIRTFLTETILFRFDKILVRGNFSLYRNNDIMNHLYETVVPGVDWRDVVSTDENRLFDEWAGIYKLAVHRDITLWKPEIILDIDRSWYDLRRTIADNVWPQVMYYEDGRVFRWQAGAAHPSEFLLIHLQKRLLRPPTFDPAQEARIYCTPTGFLPGTRAAPLRAEMRRINPRSLTGTALITIRRVWRQLLMILRANG